MTMKEGSFSQNPVEKNYPLCVSLIHATLISEFIINTTIIAECFMSLLAQHSSPAMKLNYELKTPEL